MMKIETPILCGALMLGSMLLASSVLAEKEECIEIEKQYISLNYNTTISATDDAGAVFAEKLSTFESIAKELKLSDYNITSRDMSAYHSGGSSSWADTKPRYEMSISLAANFSPNEKAFDTYLKNAKADSVNTYISTECKEK